MRIRKNKKLSSLLLLSTAANPDEQLVPTHFCQLNQSPWDVIPFHHHTQVLPSFEELRDESPTGCRSAFGRNDNGFAARTGCSLVGPVDSIDEKPFVGFGDEDCKIGGELSGPALRTECAKTDGKFWKCKRESKEGHRFCEHHTLQLKSYSSGNVGSGPGRERAARKKKKGESSSSVSGGSSQYYYYYGFGPWWKKNRGDRPEWESSALQSVNEGTGYVHFDGEPDVDDDDEEEDKKRVRKPIKARSLKSLM